MAVTERLHTGDDSTTLFPFEFEYLKPTDVKVTVNGEPKIYQTHWDFNNSTSINFTTAPPAPPANGSDNVRIYRETDDSSLKARFYPGSAIKAQDLNDNFTQNLFVTQEATNNAAAAWQTGDETIISSEDWESNNTRIATTGAIDGRVDSKINTAITTKVVGGDRVTATASGGDTVTLKVTPESLVNGDINGAAAIDGTKVSPNFGSQNVATTGTLASGAATITGNIVVSGTISDAGGNLELNDNVEISGTLDVDGNTTLDDATVDGTLDVNGSSTIDNVQIDGNEIDTTSGTLTLDSNDGTVIVDDNLTVNGSVDLDDITGDGVVTSGTSTSDTKVYSAKRCDELYYNLASGEEIQSGETWEADDAKIATTAAIDARIIDLVDDVGGFVAIDSENDFPNDNPDVNNPPGPGTIVSIKALSESIVTGSGETSNNTIAQTEGGSAVNITGLTENTTYTAGFGLLVETTATLNTYTFHRYVPNATSVTTVAGNTTNINKVAAIDGDVTKVADIDSNVTKVANIDDKVTDVANDEIDIGIVAGAIGNVNTVAGKATEIGLLGTSEAVADLALLGTEAAVADMALLGDSDVIADMALLGDSAVIADMAAIADTANLITNIGTVAGIHANVTTVAGDTTAINNITTNLSAVQNAATNATNAASSATAAASSATSAATSATTATTQATTATTEAATATTEAANASVSAASAAASANTATAQASAATTQATNSAASASSANSYQYLAKQYRDTASGLLTQNRSIAYNLSDSASTHTDWGDITDGETADFADESSNTFLTMAEGSATYNYGSIT